MGYKNGWIGGACGIGILTAGWISANGYWLLAYLLVGVSSWFGGIIAAKADLYDK